MKNPPMPAIPAASHINRRQFLRASALGTAALALAPRRALAAGAPNSAKPNILLVMADDLNHWIGCLGRNPQTRTPNIDRFAKQSVNFMHAYCPASVCNPSRVAFMSGLHPSTTGVYGNANLPWSDYIDEKKALNGYLKANGYYTLGAGKIYHIGGKGASSHSEGVQWDRYGATGGGEDDPGPGDSGDDSVPRNAARAARVGGGGGRGKTVRFADIQAGPIDAPDSSTGDYQNAQWAAAQLQKNYDKPFFMAIGFHKPHLPFVVPQKYFDMFPLETIQLPPYLQNDSDDLPASGKHWTHDVRWKAVYGSGDATGIKNWKTVIQAYLAAVAFTDAQMGTVFDALEKSPHKDNTIVLVLADHGWHFGEKQHFGKTTLWEESTRIPFIWKVPGLTPAAGATCVRPVESLSIFPTLCELTGLPAPAYLQGVSIAKLLADPNAEWTRPALTTYGYKNHGVRTEQWRYIRYANGDEELYDEKADPYEWHNLATDRKYDTVKKELAKAMPTENAPDKSKAAKSAAAPRQDITEVQAQRRAARRAAAGGNSNAKPSAPAAE